MTDIYLRLITGDPSRESLGELAAAVAASNQFELERAVDRLDQRSRIQVCIAVADRVRGHKTLSSLELGALLTLFQLVTDEESRSKQFQSMEEETGIKRTQLYRTIAMFRVFGRPLLAEPDTASRCTCEALKILSAESVSQEAQKEALEFARGGKRLTIKEAKLILRKHAETPVSVGKKGSQSNSDDQATGVKPTLHRFREISSLWQFADSSVRVLIQPTGGPEPIGGEEIVLALEAALEKAKREYVATESNQQPLQTA